jgi:hypothetical protein
VAFLGFPFHKVKNGSAIVGVKMCYINALGSGCARVDVPRVAVMQKQLPVPAPSNGVLYQRPDMACATNSTPRISNINGMQSPIQFKPGDTLTIVGCGFGNSIGRVFLRDNSVTLIVTDWSNAQIKAHIDPALSRVSDFAGVSLIVQPNGAPVLSSKAVYSFRAAREDVFMAVDAKPHSGIAVVYSNYLRCADNEHHCHVHPSITAS